MSIAKMPNIGGIRPIDSGASKSPNGLPGLGDSFKDALNSANNKKMAGQVGTAQDVGPLKFSSHAISRMQHRGVRFDPSELQQIEGAVAKAKAKGSKETLILSDKAAMIVSVKDNTVVTVMDKSNMKDNVFTKIDSTVVI